VAVARWIPSTVGTWGGPGRGGTDGGDRTGRTAGRPTHETRRAGRPIRATGSWVRSKRTNPGEDRYRRSSGVADALSLNRD